MNGFIVIDKPRGASSFDVVRQLRRLLKIRRIGHCGTLDPLATGVLPVAVGEATRLVEFVMDGAKVYRAELKLGEKTDTQDAEGTIIASRPLTGIDPATIHAAAQHLIGPIMQIPPMYSALKREGVPLYRLARQGVEVERQPRAVTIEHLDLLRIELPLVTLEVTCSKGTYIRTLADDLGESLGCGAHLTALRRLRSGPFTEGDTLPLADLTPEECRAHLLPPTAALAGFPAVELATEASVQRMRNGIPPALNEVSLPSGVAPGRVVTLQHLGNILAIARFEPERIEELRGDFSLLRVFPTNL